MKLTCYVPPDQETVPSPAPVRRTWMDETPSAFAYRCLPLVIANGHGWEFRCPTTFEAIWNGGSEAEDIRFGVTPGTPPPVNSHFGSGILTFAPMVVLRTEPGYNLWVTGPINQPKDGICPLSAVVETDWMPYSFTMNWKMTHPGARVRFEKGEPYCFFFPIKRGLVDGCEPAIKPLSADPELAEEHREALAGRRSLRDVAPEDRHSPETRRVQDWYLRGAMPDGSRTVPEHQTRVRAKPFRPPAPK